MTDERYPCPCCGYLTFDQRTPGTDEICKVCYWQDDWVSFTRANIATGPNRVSLNEARENFARFGVSEERFSADVRPPRPEELPPG